MTELLGMACIIRERVVDLAHQQILTIIQAGNSFFFGFHAVTLPAFRPIVNPSVLRKSYGYHFDTGATLFLMPELYAQTFTALGERMEDHLDLRRIDPTYHLYFKDDSKLQFNV